MEKTAVAHQNEGIAETSATSSPQRKANPSRLAILMVGLGLSVFCVALDNTILATAIPKISQQFGTLEDVGWYGSAYFLTICSVTLLFGRLYTFYSLKWVFLAAVALFELGSLICGVAPTSAALVIGRAVAGLGSGGILPGAILIITQDVPLDQRALYNALIMGMASIAGVLGPLIGGALTEHATWRWCFYINLPMGGITILTVLLFFRSPSTSPDSKVSARSKILSLDIEGLVIFICAITCLVLALEWGGSKYHWQNARIIVLLVICAVLLTVWVLIQRRKKERATIPPRVIVQRNVWAAAVYSVFFSGAYYAMTYYIPIWLQAVKAASPVKSGIMNTPLIIGITVTSILTGALVNLFGHYAPLMLAGSILLTVGCGLCTTFTPSSNHSEWIGFQALVGIGAGTGYNLPLIAVQVALRETEKDIPVGTAIVIFGQNLSSTLFIAIAQTVFQARLRGHVAAEVDGVKPQAAVEAGAAELAGRFPAEVLPALRGAFNGAVTDTFYLAVAGGAVSIVGVVFLQWLSAKKGKGDGENRAAVVVNH